MATDLICYQGLCRLSLGGGTGCLRLATWRKQHALAERALALACERLERVTTRMPCGLSEIAARRDTSRA